MVKTLQTKPHLGEIRSVLVQAVWMLGGLVSCSGRSETVEGLVDVELDLLRNAPDLVVEELGYIEPEPGRPFGNRAVGTWRYAGGVPAAPKDGAGRSSETPMAECVHPSGGVLLGKTRREDTSVSLWLGAPAVGLDGQVVELLVELNDVEIGRVELPDEPEEFRFEVPRRLWSVGDNLLKITGPTTFGGPGHGSGAYRLGPISWGHPARVRAELDARILRMAPFTSAGYGIEPRGAGLLEFSVSPATGGVLDWELVRFDPISFEESESIVDGERALEAGEDLELELAFEAGSSPLRFKLGWRSESGGELTVSRAVVQARAPERPDVILIGIDTFSASHTSLYGYPRPTTPRLSEFASEAILFDPLITNATWTLPSFLSMLSGLPSGAHQFDRVDGRVERVQGWETLQLAPNRWTLAEAFLGAGWRTGAFVDTPWISPEFGFEQGFEVLDSSSVLTPLADRDGGLTQVVSLAEDWLDTHAKGEPSFLFLHAYDLHGPYLAPPVWRERFADNPPGEWPESVPVDGPLPGWDAVATYIVRGEQPEGPLPPRMDPRRFVNAYDAGIAEVDAKLGELFDRWRADGRLDRSILMLTSDHGESMTEQHRLFGHASIGSAVTRVPLMVRLPNGEHGGTRIRGPYQTVDLMPTLLELCGFDLSERGLPGRSAAAELRGTAPGRDSVAQAERIVVTQHGTYDHQALEQGRWRLVRIRPYEDPVGARLTYPFMDPKWRQRYFPETVDGTTLADGVRIAARHDTLEEISDLINGGLPAEAVFLYDLGADPLELQDLAADQPDLVFELLAQLDAALEGTERLRKLGRPAEAVRGITESDLEILRAFGYVESAPESDPEHDD